MAKYKIIRFFRNNGSRVVMRGLSLEEAQAHCSNPDTRGSNWFDGYEQE